MAHDPSSGEGRWRRHPRLAFVLRAAVVLVPVIAGVAAGLAVSRLLPGTHTLWPILAWWAIVLGAALLVQIVAGHLARRLLPLAVLLRLSLLFPDQAPSRYTIALRSQTSRKLQAEIDYPPRDRATAIRTVLTLVAGLGAHDRGSRGHSERVRAYVELLAEQLHLEPMDRERLCWAALLHDVGKTTVPVSVLNAPGRPDDAGWAAIHRHPEEGARLAAPLRGWLGDWALAIEQHHEHFDGTGYPLGLSGDEVSKGARIVAVADSFEVITAPRPYKAARTAAAGRAELARSAGTHFDPDIVRAFLNVSIGSVRMAMGPLAWLGELPFLGGLARLRRDAVAMGTEVAATFSAVAVIVGVAAGGATARLATAHPKSPTAVLGVQIQRPAGAGAGGSATTTATSVLAGAASGAIPPAAQQQPLTGSGTGTTGTGTPPGSSSTTNTPTSTTTTSTTTTRPGPTTTTTTTTRPGPTTTTTTATTPPTTIRATKASTTASSSVPLVIIEFLAQPGQPLPVLTILSAPQHGILELFPSVAAVVYTPDPTYAGPDSFSYEICAATCVVNDVAVSVSPAGAELPPPPEREGRD